MAADAEATLPALIEAVKRLTTADRKRVFDDRGAKLAAAGRDARGSRTNRSDVCLGRQARSARPAYRQSWWAQIKNDDWSLVSDVPL